MRATAGNTTANERAAELVSTPTLSRPPSGVREWLTAPLVEHLLGCAHPFSTSEVAAARGVSSSTVLRCARRLVELGRLVKTGAGPQTRYQTCVVATEAPASVPLAASAAAPEEESGTSATSYPPVRLTGEALDELLLQQSGYFSANAVALLAGTSVSTVVRRLNVLRMRCLVSRSGAGPTTRYLVVASKLAPQVSRADVISRGKPRMGAQGPFSSSRTSPGQQPKPLELHALGSAVRMARLQHLLQSLSGCLSVKGAVAQAAVPRRTLQRDLNLLMAQGYVRAEGSTRDRRYWFLSRGPTAQAHPSSSSPPV